jgi:hypothetical protein
MPCAEAWLLRTIDTAHDSAADCVAGALPVTSTAAIQQ